METGLSILVSALEFSHKSQAASRQVDPPPPPMPELPRELPREWLPQDGKTKTSGSGLGVARRREGTALASPYQSQCLNPISYNHKKRE